MLVPPSIHQLDLYGRAVYTDPARYPKSVQGALVSLICYGVAAVVIVVSAMKLSTAAMAGNEDDMGTIVSIATKRVKFNGPEHAAFSRNAPLLSYATPTFRASISLRFFLLPAAGAAPNHQRAQIRPVRVICDHGSNAHATGFFEDSATGNLIQAEDGRWDLPTLQLQCQSKINFFNADSRRLFKIEVA